MTSALVIPGSTLMHASLAYLSPELRTMDSIISSSHTSPRIPLELLLLIRSYLLVHATDHLIFRSSAALQRYEKSLRYLLCSECTAYNEHVYGSDIWEWQQFSGACACFASSISSSIFLQGMNSSFPNFSPLNPKKFTNRHHWLEFYLSMKAVRFTRRSGSQPKIIWELVSRVLDDFGCQSVHTEERQLDSVLVVPYKHFPEVNEEYCLKRVDRDLALSVEYTMSPLLRLPSNPNSEPSLTVDSVTTWSAVPSIQVFFLTVISLPLSILTMTITVVCFYATPFAFRII
ncbi:hypothetical protein BDP27DRAFT_1316309 [Rhodocollybia butyracea]|uniref:Uncharacterized protein n=1 Tax=Rhodocollybia butyracea TaxID=206335 RepID=A0A9P5Q5L1_9AGAR|nr:hypothetical protein BDP27DRAFT_1316309 [Rhodocollybia butyracea]